MASVSERAKRVGGVYPHGLVGWLGEWMIVGLGLGSSLFVLLRAGKAPGFWFLHSVL